MARAASLRASSHPRRWLWLLVAGGGFCGAGWLAAVTGSSGLAQGLASAAAAVPIGYGLVRVAAGAVRRLDSRDLFSPWIAFPFAYVLWFAFGTIDFVDDPLHVLYGMFDSMPPAIWGYAALGLAAYLGGVLVGSRGKDSLRVWPHAWEVENHWRPSLQQGALAGFSLLLLGCYLALVARMGVPVLSAAAAADRLAVGNFGPTQAVFLCSAWTLVVLVPASCWMGRLGAWPAAMGVAAVAVLLLSMGGRGNFFIAVLTLLIAANYLRRQIRVREVMLGTAGLFAAFSAYGFLRDSAFGGTGSLGYLDQIGIPAAAQPLVYAFTYVRGTVATLRDVTAIIPSEIPYQHGRLTLLPLATLLPGHHEMADMFFKNILGHDFVGLGQPATPLGPLYGDFGGCGIVAGMFAFGLLCGHLYRRLRRRPTTAGVLVYAWVMQAGLFGLFASLFPYISTMFVPVLWLALDRWLGLAPPIAPSITFAE